MCTCAPTRPRTQQKGRREWIKGGRLCRTDRRASTGWAQTPASLWQAPAVLAHIWPFPLHAHLQYGRQQRQAIHGAPPGQPHIAAKHLKACEAPLIRDAAAVGGQDAGIDQQLHTHTRR